MIARLADRAPHRTARLTVLLHVLGCALLDDAALAHPVSFGRGWDELQFMDEQDHRVRMIVDVLEVQDGRGTRVVNSITGRIQKKEGERSGVLASDQYSALLRSVKEGWNRRDFQSTVVTSEGRLGSTNRAPEELVVLRFARDSEGRWDGMMEFRWGDVGRALRAEFRTAENQFFVRGKNDSDWLLIVTVMEENVVDDDPMEWGPSVGPFEPLR